MGSSLSIAVIRFLVVHVSKVVCDAIAHHALRLRVVGDPSWLLDVFLVFYGIDFHFFDIYFFSTFAVSKSLVVATMHRITAFKRTVIWGTHFDNFLLRELLVGAKRYEVRVKSPMLSYIRSKLVVSVQNLVVKSRIFLS